MKTSKIIEILEKIHPTVDWANEARMADDGLIDSFDMVTLVNALSDEFGVEIEMEYIEAERFNSVAAIAELLRSLGAKGL